VIPAPSIIDATGVAYFIARDAAQDALRAALARLESVGGRDHDEAAAALAGILGDIRDQDERTCQRTGVPLEARSVSGDGGATY
jgi:hypothetical protein